MRPSAAGNRTTVRWIEPGGTSATDHATAGYEERARSLAEEIAASMRELSAQRLTIAETYRRMAAASAEPRARYFRARADHMEHLAAQALALAQWEDRERSRSFRREPTGTSVAQRPSPAVRRRNAGVGSSGASSTAQVRARISKVAGQLSGE